MNKKIYIKGMHCVACEKILEDELSNIPFVKEVAADRKKGEVDLLFENGEPSSLAIKEIVEKVGYEFSEKPWSENVTPTIKKMAWKEWIISGVIVFVILKLFLIFQDSGFVPQIDESNISLGVSFLVGLVASLSSCLVVVGSVIIAFSEKYKVEGSGAFQNSIKPNLFFHAGRLSTFFILGGLLGFLGGEINISGSLMSVYTILIAGIMFLLGLNILGLLPSVSDFGIAMPKKFSKNWSKIKQSNHKSAPFVLGALSFFLPCGFTQSMQILALISGSFWTGAMSLFLFALGTVPVLLIIGVTASWTNSRKIGIFKKVAGILILVFAFFTLNSGLALFGVKTNVIESNKKQEIEKNINDTAGKNEQVARMSITSRGFEPSIIKIKKNVPVKWIIDGAGVTGCTNKIIIPSLNISKGISKGENVITFTPEKTGEIPFSCWMGMVRGKFIVE
ncbi:MAG: sulfite exporter TauE/SafE family protein [Candidatus Moraniibacteriota bacterium]